jgi:hypothetical protein
MATAVADVSSLIDIASEPASTVVEETPVETAETVETTETPVEGETKAEASPEGEKPVDARTNPDAVRKALREFRDSKPENAPIARHLNNVVGRYEAYRQVFPKVADAQNAKVMLDAIGGTEGISGLQETIKSVNETDSLLYAGDARVLDTIIEDMRRENKLDAFGKLASPFLDKLQQIDGKAYESAIRPHFFQALVGAEFPETVQFLMEALSGEKPNLEAAMKTLKSMDGWFNKLRNSIETADKSKLDPDRQKFEQERTQFQTERQKAFQSEVNTDWNRENNRVLGEALRPYLKLPFAKNWTDGTKQSVAREITSTLLEELTADKTYQSQMDALWSEARPDKSKIINFHKSKVAIIGPRIVKQVLENRYPGFQRSAGPMKPKPVAAAAAATTTTGTQRTGNRPSYVTSKPPLDQMDMDKDPDRMHLINGRAYLKGSGKFVSWNPKDRA